MLWVPYWMALAFWLIWQQHQLSKVKMRALCAAVVLEAQQVKNRFPDQYPAYRAEAATELLRLKQSYMIELLP